MATEKRERQRENRAQRIAEAEAEQAKAKAAQSTKAIGYLLLGVVAIAGIIFLLTRGGDDDNVSTGDTLSEQDFVDDASTVDDSAAQDTVPAAVEEPVEQADTVPPAAVPFECPPEDGSAERVVAFTSAPEMCIDVTKNYTADVVTTAGTFTIEFDTENAPATANNFISLARYRFYEGVSFHRIISGFMIQGGDAVGQPSGTGGPGYQFDDELQGGDGPFYELGSVAMANSGPNTQGSQFFVVTGPSGEGLPDAYTRFGQVTAGMDVVSAIEATPTGPGDAPLEEMIIESITITES